MNDVFWKAKLMAFLHDPPCKALDIPGHETAAASFRGSAGISAEEYNAAFRNTCDHLATAADRFPFPDNKKTQRALQSGFDGGGANPFKHPLGGSTLSFVNVLLVL